MHVRNLSAELIEAQVDTGIPAPRVTARRKEDEGLAKTVEDMLRNEMDRLPMERINDLMERMVPVQGGAAFLVDWDESQHSHSTLGEVRVTALHPRQIIPQEGVWDELERADYLFVKLPQTREAIRRRYGVLLPEHEGVEPDDCGEDSVTQIIAFWRNDRGGVGRFSWADETVLEDLEDYQLRRVRRCRDCGAAETAETPQSAEPTAPLGRGAKALSVTACPLSVSPSRKIGAASSPKGGAKSGDSSPGGGAKNLTGDEVDSSPEGGAKGRKVCPVCGGTRWTEAAEETETLRLPPPPGLDGSAVEISVPCYRPGCYPLVLQKNVSVYGKFLGESDMDKIADQQRTANRIESKIIDKLLRSGSYITLPDDASIRVDSEDMKVIRPGTHQNKELIGVYDLQGDVGQDLAYLAQVYEEARQIIGITDSYQGRKDSTATSGRAKEFSAAQAAGRMESKRVMKQAAYAALYETIFRFRLAYTDEPRSVVSSGLHGETLYSEFDRLDFLEQDAAGEWFWNDRFLFSCDDSAPLAGNREALWQETRMNLQTGAFGDPADPDTLILFWTKMRGLRYPLAEDTLEYLKARKRAARTAETGGERR